MKELVDKNDVWAALAAPLAAGVISWRQDGRAMQRDGKYFARFVCYVDANTVRERLDSVVPGEWDLTLELLPNLAGEVDALCSFKARLQILGVIREDVGTGRDYKSAATDAFKRAAVRFGIGHELYAYEQNWVQVDGDGKFAKPLEDPAAAYARRHGNNGSNGNSGSNGTNGTRGGGDASSPAPSPAGESTPAPAYPAGNHIDDRAPLDNVPDGPMASDEPSCPKCGGRMWDNRLSKRNPKAPDFKCRNRTCDGVIWPPKSGGRSAVPAPEPREPAKVLADDDDDLPF